MWAHQEKENIMKVIFLDIDGVLNSIDSIIAFAAKKHHVGFLHNADRLDPVSVGLLQRACIESGASIVISSTWRKLYNEDEFVNIFKEYGWEDFPIIGVTDNANSCGQTRGNEIQRWLDANDNPEYVIVDDDSDMLHIQHERFVHVSNVSGFRTKHYCRVLRLFDCVDVHLEQLESQVRFKRKSNVGEC